MSDQDLINCKDKLLEYPGEVIYGDPPHDIKVDLAAIDPDHQEREGQLDDAIIEIYEATLGMEIDDEYDTNELPAIIDAKPGLTDNQRTCLKEAIEHYNTYINGMESDTPTP
ncbi:MAG: hypothetical protein P1U34_05730 [Coxiellaceae bacterium]|nr:hypothetical protein [Coxiellaceae bacterium]